MYESAVDVRVERNVIQHDDVRKLLWCFQGSMVLNVGASKKDGMIVWLFCINKDHSIWMENLLIP